MVRDTSVMGDRFVVERMEFLEASPSLVLEEDIISKFSDSVMPFSGMYFMN
jgi:hypothetical protein